MTSPRSLNRTVPPSGTGFTVAVSVTGCPTGAGLRDGERPSEVELAAPAGTAETRAVTAITTASRATRIARRCQVCWRMSARTFVRDQPVRRALSPGGHAPQRGQV